MISSKNFLKSKTAQKLPPAIKNHTVFSTCTNLVKIFPQIGLPNDYVRNAYIDPAFGKLDLVFSSDGVRGLWDLASMSMRGALSCMHWNNSHSTHLIGSVIDPFCGIIYLTDNKKTEYGRSIMKRSLVRLVQKGDSPCLFIERPYTKTDNTDPQVYNNKCVNPGEIVDVFKKYLSSKVGLEVRSPWSPYLRLQMPYSSLFDSMPSAEQSLSDFGLGYAHRTVGETWLKELRHTPSPEASRPLTTP